MEINELLKTYIRLVLESAPSKLNIREPTLSADSTGYENSHLNKKPNSPELGDEDVVNLAPHLRDQHDAEDNDIHGPVPPKGMDPLMVPDPFVRGQHDNVTWAR